VAASIPKKYNLLLYSCEVFVVCFLFFFVSWGVDVKEREVAGYVHTKARIEKIWKECRKYCYKIGEITFQREQNGQTIACRAVVGLGSHSAQDILDIALEPNSCYSPTVLGSPTGSAKPLMVIFGAAALVAFGLTFVGYRVAFGRKSQCAP
jgi:hypothetical protein